MKNKGETRMSMEREAWNKLVEKTRSLKSKEEQEVQKMWENFFTDGSLFGYSRVFNEMSPQYPVQIGVKTVKADILIKNDTNNLFVVELKKFDHALSKKDDQQLVSYMRCLQLSVGVLICNEVYLYVFHNGKTEHLKIPFDKDTQNGTAFISLLRKENFSSDKVINFVISTKERIARIAEIKEEIQKVDLSVLIKEYLKGRYREDEIEEALRDKEVMRKTVNAISAFTDKPASPAARKPTGKSVPMPAEKPESSANIKPTENPIFYYNGSLKAKGILANGSFVLLKGSEIKPELKNSAPSYTVRARKNYANKIMDGKTTDDITFSSSSAAASFVGGSSMSGNRMWHTDRGEAPKDFKKEKE